MAVSATPCVYFAPKSSRPWYDPATDEEPNDCVCALSLGPPFRYVIPGFDVLAVKMRQMRIKGYNTAGEERTYDIFVRNDPSVNRCYPVWMEIKDATVVETNTFQCVMTTDGLFSFVIYLYADGMIQWTTGDASGGTGGFGGTPAQVGFNAGSGNRSATVPESRTDAIVNIDTTSNIRVPGLWVFRVDGENVDEGGCSPQLEVSVTLAPRAGNYLGGTAVLVAGACLNESDNIVCTFDDTDVEGTYMDELSALCVSPQIQYIGEVPFRLVVRNADRVIRSQGETVFHLLSLEDAAKVTFDATTRQKDAQFSSGDSVEVTWNPADVFPMEEADSYTVDITLHGLQVESENVFEAVKLAAGIPNSGSSRVNIPAISSISDVGVVSIQVTVATSDDIRARRTIGIRLIGIWSPVAYVVLSAALRTKCNIWSHNQPRNIGKDLLAEVLPCPPNRAQASSDSRFLPENRLISFIFHPGSSGCFRQVVNAESCLPSAQCCYDDSDKLLIGQQSGGTVDKVSPQGPLKCYKEHFVQDVLPAIYCCSGFFSSCNVYYRHRPSVRSDGYRLRARASMVGDPHMVTLDGLHYTFNGRGEFLLIGTTDNSLTVQGRMTPALDMSGGMTRGTVFSAVVARLDDSDTVQIEVRSIAVSARINGEIVNFVDAPRQIFRNVTVHDEGNNTITAYFTGGVTMSATVELGIISKVSISLANIFENNTFGLLGNFNGNSSDDLLPRGGRTPVATSSSLQEIHEMFGITWIVNNSADSLFSYRIGQSFTDFIDESFVPAFATTFSDPALQSQAEAICGDDQFCLFDIATTDRTDIGLTTLSASQEIEEIVMLSVPIICDPPCVNGACVANDTCNCAESYEGPLCSESRANTTCPVNPCENGGTCHFEVGSYICLCPLELTGSLCEIIPPQKVRLVNDSPRIFGNSVEVNFTLARPASSVTCHLSGQPQQNCVSGHVIFAGLSPRRYSLRIEVKTRNEPTVIFRRQFEISSVPHFCTLHLINGGITVDRDNRVVKIEFVENGPVESFRCSLDRQTFLPCVSPMLLTDMAEGNHRVKVLPLGCGRQRRALIFDFTV